MKILVTGNMGYIGPCVVKQLRASYPDSTLVGFDIGYFGACITNLDLLPESRVDLQYFGDVRRFPEEVLEGVEVIVHLAAISNDPIGNRFEEVTLDINHRASIDLAKKAKKCGVKSFVFAAIMTTATSEVSIPRRTIGRQPSWPNLNADGLGPVADNVSEFIDATSAYRHGSSWYPRCAR